MTALDTASDASNFQAEIIIPRHFFSTSYDSVLNSIDGILTRTERKLLSLFAFRAYKDGEIFPKQGSIAHKLGICVRQVRRVISSLVKKGFLSVLPPTLVDRHCYGKGNRYHFLNHPAYGPSAKMSSEMSSENAGPSIKDNKVIKKNKGVLFNPYEFVERHLGQGHHAQSIADALNSITARMGSIRHPEAYGNRIVDVQSGNYYAAEHHAADEERKQEPPTASLNLLEKLGFQPKSMPKRRVKTQNEIHHEIRAWKGIPDRRCAASLADR